MLPQPKQVTARSSVAKWRTLYQGWLIQHMYDSALRRARGERGELLRNLFEVPVKRYAHLRREVDEIPPGIGGIRRSDQYAGSYQILYATHCGARGDLLRG